MSSSRPRAASARADWRAMAPSAPSSAGRWVKRLLSTALLVGLVAWLGWLLYQHFQARPALHVAWLPITDYDVTLPPIPFPREQAAELEKLAHSAHGHFAAWNRLQTSESLPTLPGLAAGLTTDSRSGGLLYIAAQGVTQDGKPYLLCSDYLRTSGTSGGKYALGELLSAVQQARPATKLVVLDVSHLAIDPWLGMLCSEFSRLAEKEVARIQDPGLWVLMSQTGLQRAQLSYKTKQSALGYFVVQGLLGAADQAGNQDGAVDLDELWNFVRTRVPDWVVKRTRDQVQTPRLFRGGIGEASPPPKIFLAQPSRRKVSAQEAAAAEPPTPAAAPAAPVAPGPLPAAAAPAAGKDDAAGGTGKPPASQAAAKTDAKTDAKPTASPSPPGKPATKPETAAPPAKESTSAQAGSESPPTAPPSWPDDGMARLLEKAWQARDARQDRRRHPWIARDYAPHLWHEYEVQLLGYECRYRLGVPLLASQQDELKRLALETEAPAPLEAERSGAGDVSVLGRLNRAAHLFEVSPVRESFQALPPHLAGVRQAIQLRDDLLALVRDYVGWHAAAVGIYADRPPLDETVVELLSRQLPRYLQILEGLEGEARLPVAGARQVLEELTQRTAELGEVRRQLESPASRLPPAVELRAGMLKDVPQLAPFLDGLLSVPLLSSSIRGRAVAELRSGDLPLTVPTGVVEEPTRVIQRSADQLWQRMRDHARLELLLVRLAVPDYPLLGDRNLAIDDLVEHQLGIPRDAAEQERLWEVYRRLGKELGEFYRGLPEQINKSLPVAASAQQQQAARLLRLVDARDARRVADALSLALRVPSPQRVREPVFQIVVTPNKAELSRSGGWSEVAGEVRLADLGTDRAGVQWQFDPTRLEVLDAVSGKAIVSAQVSSIRVPADKPAQVKVRLRPRPGSDWAGTTGLSLRARAGEQFARADAVLNLPPPDVVEIALARVVDRSGGTRVDEVPTPLGPPPQVPVRACAAFAGRTTEYVLQLKNLAAREKKVRVELWAPPADWDARADARRSPVDSRGRRLPGFQLLASATEVKLPAEGEGGAIALSPPKVPAAEPTPETKSKSKPEAAAKPTAETSKKPSVTRGLICVVYDETSKESRKQAWVTWIDFWLVPPYRYLAADVNYRPDRIDVALRARATGLAPVVSAEAPLQVHAEFSGLPETDRAKKTSAILGDPAADGNLYAELSPGFTGNVRLSMDVDGYPRAMSFTIPCDRPRSGIERQRDRLDVQMVSPANDSAFRTPLTKDIPLIFAVDAPDDAFARPEDTIDVWTEYSGNRETIKSLHAERQVEMTLEDPGTEGILRVRTAVHDFHISFNPGEVSDQWIRVGVDLQLGSLAQRSAAMRAPGARPSKAIRLALDGTPPEIKAFVPPRTPVVQGDDAVFLVEVQDALSGVAKIEFGIDRDGSGVLEEKEKLIELVPPQTEGPQRLLVPTKELTPERIYQVILAATDRVGLRRQKTATFQVVARPAPTPEPAMAAPATPPPYSGPGTIRGRLIDPMQRTGVDCVGGKVVLVELGLTASADRQGNFTFENVPQGSYKLRATAIFGNRTEGEGSVVVKDREQRADIPMHEYEPPPQPKR